MLQGARVAFEQAYPEIYRRVVGFFRIRSNWHAREECIAETIGLLWELWLRAVKRGRNPQDFLTRFVWHACHSVARGCRVVHPGYNDAFHSRRPGERPERIRSLSGADDNTPRSDLSPLNGVESENPAERAAFNVDYPEWLESFGEKDTRIIHQLALGYTAQQVARRESLSHSSVHRYRARYRDSWQDFTE